MSVGKAAGVGGVAEGAAGAVTGGTAEGRAGGVAEVDIAIGL